MKLKRHSKPTKALWTTVLVLAGLILANCTNRVVSAESGSRDKSGENMTDSAGASHSMLFSTFIGHDKLDENGKRELAKFVEAYELQKANKSNEAMKLYREVTTACPDRFEAFYNLGVCQQDLGQFPDALQSFEKVVRLNRLFKPVYGNLAAVHEKLGEPEKAKAVRAVLNQL